ncbi:MAG: hypothetical protein HRU17_01520 [Polyangiaceae bacterium]|nr:hypothetical protein [Polyangiaceae bacterium]
MPSFRQLVRQRFALLMLLATVGCGSKEHDDIPDGLLSAIANAGSATTAWEGPYGNRTGDVIAEHCFDGWQDPSAAQFDSESMSEICLSDFYDPTGNTSRILHISTSAGWCASCGTEYQGTASRPSLSARWQQRRAQGFAVLGTLFQDNNENPATPADASIWTELYNVDFPFAVDPSFQLGLYADESVQPFNMLIDTTTMTIITQLEGDNPEVLWSAVDQALTPN